MFVDILNGIRTAVFTIIMIPFIIVSFALSVALSIIYVLFGYVSVKKFWAWCKSGVYHMVESGDDYLEF